MTLMGGLDKTTPALNIFLAHREPFSKFRLVECQKLNKKIHCWYTCSQKLKFNLKYCIVHKVCLPLFFIRKYLYTMTRLHT